MDRKTISPRLDSKRCYFESVIYAHRDIGGAMLCMIRGDRNGQRSYSGKRRASPCRGKSRLQVGVIKWLSWKKCSSKWVGFFRPSSSVGKMFGFNRFHARRDANLPVVYSLPAEIANRQSASKCLYFLEYFSILCLLELPTEVGMLRVFEAKLFPFLRWNVVFG